jgi:hypothetical protein
MSGAVSSPVKPGAQTIVVEGNPDSARFFKKLLQAEGGEPLLCLR